MRLLSILLLVTGLVACEIAPSYITESREVDSYLIRGQYKSACVGLRMEDDDDLRRYTAQKLVDYATEPQVHDCVCEALYSAETGRFDPAVADGVRASRSDAFAQCLAEGLGDPRVEDQVALARAVGAIVAPSGYEALATAARSDQGAAVRAAATQGLRPSEAHRGLLVELLGGDAEAEVRTAAAEALVGSRDEAVVQALTQAATTDTDARVRAAAVASLPRKDATAAVACQLMLEDPEEAVRLAAVEAWSGTSNEAVLECLEKRLTTLEESAAVRSATMEALRTSSSEEAADILCRSIGPFLRLHVVDAIAEHTDGVNIIEIHNDRDWQNSYECVRKALARGGYSCYARNHLGHWFRTFGGSAPTPWCPGMIKNEPGN